MASFILPLVSGLAGLFGGGNQKTVNTSGSTTGQSSGSSTGNSSSSSGFNYNPLQQSLMNNFSASANNQLKNATDLTPYTSQGLQQIQGQGNANQTAISNNLASRGLSFSPAAATAETQNTLNTGNQSQNFLSQIPLLQNQLQTQAQTNAENAFRAPGIATTNTGTTSGSTTGETSGQTDGTQTTSGNPLAGLFGGLGAGLAAPSGSGGNLLSQIMAMFGGGSGNATPNYNSNTGTNGGMT